MRRKKNPNIALFSPVKIKLPKRPKKKSIAALRRKADALFQERLKELKPYSIISGKPTEVGHHFIPKSQSNNLRYDFRNVIPLTNSEHCRHHLSGDPSIVAKIIEVNGMEWVQELQRLRSEPRKLNREYLEFIITNLSK